MGLKPRMPNFLQRVPRHYATEVRGIPVIKKQSFIYSNIIRPKLNTLINTLYVFAKRIKTYHVHQSSKIITSIPFHCTFHPSTVAAQLLDPGSVVSSPVMRRKVHGHEAAEVVVDLPQNQQRWVGFLQVTIIFWWLTYQ